MLAWLHTGTGDTLQFTGKELADAAGVSRESTDAFLGRFSLTFGEFRSREWPPDIEDVRGRPLVRDADYHHICVSPASLLWAIRPAFEAAIKEVGGRSFTRWERHRRRVVEQRAVDALASALRADWSYASLYYEVTEGGKQKRPELDGIMWTDSCVLFVEAKASSMRAAARRVAPAALRSWITDELGKAAQQARRARDAILGEDASIVTDEGGRPVELDVAGVRRSYEIVVILEDLPGIASLTWQMADLGLLASDPTPLVVHLHDLELICELVERPAQLIQYLERRRRLDRQRRVWAQDELDYFMNYLGSDGLFWPDIPPTADPDEQARSAPIRLLSFTDSLDAYFAVPSR